MKKLLTLAVAAAMTLSVAAASATTLKLSEVHAEGYPTTLADHPGGMFQFTLWLAACEGEVTRDMLEEITEADAKAALVGEEEQKQADSENVAQLAERGEQE